MAELSDVIKSIVNEDAVGARNAVSEILFAKVKSVLEDMRVEVAQSLFESPPEDVEVEEGEGEGEGDEEQSEPAEETDDTDSE